MFYHNLYLVRIVRQLDGYLEEAYKRKPQRVRQDTADNDCRHILLGLGLTSSIDITVLLLAYMVTIGELIGGFGLGLVQHF